MSMARLRCHQLSDCLVNLSPNDGSDSGSPPVDMSQLADRKRRGLSPASEHGMPSAYQTALYIADHSTVLLKALLNQR